MVEKKKKMPRGGSKGGTRFPRLELSKAVSYSKKLVSKTHTGPHPSKIILPGVFDNAGPVGQIRASALKQYGLLKGTPKAYEASPLAQNINSATPQEKPAYLKETFLAPKLFKTLFDTFCNDEVARSKIRQQASNLDVHPDSLDECVSIFVDSAVFSGLAFEKEDMVEFHAIPTLLNQKISDENEITDVSEINIDTEDVRSGDTEKGIQKGPISPRTNVDIKIDPSMDPEKLDKLLAVLRRYGQI